MVEQSLRQLFHAGTIPKLVPCCNQWEDLEVGELEYISRRVTTTKARLDFNVELKKFAKPGGSRFALFRGVELNPKKERIEVP